ncbi:isoform X1 [Asimina triloba]
MEEKRSKRRKSNRGYEENTMAIIDDSGLKYARDREDDRLSFLEAIRQGSIISEDASMPTRYFDLDSYFDLSTVVWAGFEKMSEAIFEILKDGSSLELMMESFQLLVELDKCFPRVYLSHSDMPEASGSLSIELIVDEEVWSPFILGPEHVYSEKEAVSRNSCEQVDSHRFYQLIQDLAKAVCEKDSQLQRTKVLRDMLTFQYLLNVLEGDFIPRCNGFLTPCASGKVSVAEVCLPHLSMAEFVALQGSRKINFKNLVRECLHIIAERSDYHSGINPHELRREEAVADCDIALSIAVAEQECIVLQSSAERFLEP